MGYGGAMGRWAPDAAIRLERAALELFAEQGYADTTVPQIAARAGLTTRTYFRHFADKRDVLFLREREFPVVVSAVLAGAPGGLTPIDLVMHGFDAVARDGFDAWREAVRARRRIIRSDAHLRERELLKSSALAGAIEGVLVEHGLEARDAALLSSFGVLVFDAALDDWLEGANDRPLHEVLRETRDRLGRLTG
jgi:AcrR family transcriptional regulator